MELEVWRNKYMEVGEWKGVEEVEDVLSFFEWIKERVRRPIVFNIVYSGKRRDVENYMIYFYDERVDRIDRVVGEVEMIRKRGKYYIKHLKYKKVVIFDKTFLYDVCIGEGRGDKNEGKKNDME